MPRRSSIQAAIASSHGWRSASLKGSIPIVCDVTSPESYEAICKVDTGTSINAEPWGGHISTEWVKIKFQGENFIPYAWVNVSMGALHTC